MPKGDVHEPELPGVRTYSKDVLLSENAEVLDDTGVTFGDPKTSTPTTDNIHLPEEVIAPKSGHSGDSILTNKDDVFDVSRAFDTKTEYGTIVTDKKREKMAVGTAIAGAFGEWFDQKRKSIKKIQFFKRKKKPTVLKVGERADTVREAAELAIERPHDDHTVIVEKIKTFQHDAEAVTGEPFHVKKALVQASEGTEWTHHVGDIETKKKPATILAPPIKEEPTLDLRALAKGATHTDTERFSFRPSEPRKEILTPITTPTAPLSDRDIGEKIKEHIPKVEEVFEEPVVAVEVEEEFAEPVVLPEVEEVFEEPVVPIEREASQPEDSVTEEKDPLIPEVEVPT